MRVYLDICCLKRPFDDQSQPRIQIETTAVLAILREWREGRLELVRSDAHELENEQNSNPLRAAIVRGLLNRMPPSGPPPQAVRDRVISLESKGVRPFDGYHLAWAEHLRADAFLTTDDRLLRRAAGLVPGTLRLMGPVQWVEELPS
jgi:predicted nucleic acid-binding protein